MAHTSGRRMIALAIAACGSWGTAYAGPARISNKQPYRVTATATATGRTGSATMGARALIDRDHHGALEVVAGDFEMPPAGSLTKIQLKSYDGNGDLLFATNFTPVSAPFVTLPLASLERGQALEVQGNIRNVDNTRTDVVTVTAVGKLRPDLAVLRVDAPENAPVGMPVHITATIAELNHDTGARATCVLSIDSQTADKAEGIWVDGGDTVSCAFSRVFTAAGVHQARVEVTDVNPGDWDGANNSGTAAVAVFSAEESFKSGTASVSSSLQHYRTHSTGFTRHANDNLVMTWDYLNDQFNDSEGAQYVAYIFGTAVPFPLTQIVVSQWTDDRLIHAGVYNNVGTTSTAPYWACGQVVDDTADQAAHIEVCTYAPPGGTAGTGIAYGRFAGTVTYFASNYQAAWYETPDGVVPVYEYSYNYRSGTSVGTPGGLGETYRFEVTLIAGGIAYSRPVTVPIGPQQLYSDVNYPWACREDSDPYYGYKKICQEYINFSSGRFGLVTW